ncbi:hypothetical protein VG539_001659 [Cronobacter muytjensii]|nr:MULTISPECIES: hypothetical protein [Cronobacter]ELY4100538.1 hypothetical protein [Cronobacter sakazakii]MDI6456608.1 hypothetical protein [Cronobacter muytjensii]MEB8575142.1 hypothetical protein [Cronobacter sakazakii]MEB8607949.1 hypothetical protein [Cronobacter sakazakii]
MKIHDLFGAAGFGLLVAASYLRFGLAPALAVAGSGFLMTGLAMARNRRR